MWEQFVPREGFLRPPLGIFQFLPWNSKVPPLELKSSKRGSIFGTRMCYGISVLRAILRGARRSSPIGRSPSERSLSLTNIAIDTVFIAQEIGDDVVMVPVVAYTS